MGPSGFARSVIVMTRRCIRTVFAFLGVPVVILGIWANLSMSDASPSHCMGCVQGFLIHRDPFISARHSHKDRRKLLSMYLISVFVLWSLGVTNPDVSWMWLRLTRILFATVLSHLSCIRMYGI